MHPTVIIRVALPKNNLAKPQHIGGTCVKWIPPYLFNIALWLKVCCPNARNCPACNRSHHQNPSYKRQPSRFFPNYQEYPYGI